MHEKNTRDQYCSAKKEPAGIKGKGFYIIQSLTLGYKGNPPDQGRKEQHCAVSCCFSCFCFHILLSSTFHSLMYVFCISEASLTHISTKATALHLRSIRKHPQCLHTILRLDKCPSFLRVHVKNCRGQRICQCAVPAENTHRIILVPWHQRIRIDDVMIPHTVYLIITLIGPAGHQAAVIQIHNLQI